MKRWLWWSGILLGAVVAAAVGIWLFLISYWAIAGQYGTNLWAKNKAEYEAKGFSFDPLTYLPRPIPEEENFAASPIWKYMVGAKEKKGSVRYKVALFETLKSVKKWRAENKIPSTDWRRGEISVPPPETLFDGAQDQLNELYAAAARPGCQFPFPYNHDNPSATELPHVGPSMDLGRVLPIHASIALAQGNTELAEKDMSLCFKLARGNVDSFSLIGTLVGYSLYQRSLEILWQGIENHNWSEPQLAAFQKQLTSVDLLQSGSDGLRGELVLTELTTLSWLQRQPKNQRMSGLCDLTKCTMADYYINKLMPAMDAKAHRFYADKVPAQDTDILPKWRCMLNPMDMIAVMMLPASDGFLIKSAQNQSYLDMAQVACGLERYWLVNRKYPATLAELEPKFIAKVPHDLCNGEPLHYRVEADGNYALYSVGFNGSDDGGKVVMQKDSATSIDPKLGDWVWPRQGFSQSSPRRGE